MKIQRARTQQRSAMRAPSCRWLIVFFFLGSALFGRAQTRPTMPVFNDGDPALVPILVWQLQRGYNADAERLMRANMPQMKSRLEGVIRDIDRQFDIIGRFGAVSIHFGPGYGDLEAKDRGYDKLFTLYRKLGGDENLYKRFEARKFRIEGAHLTNEGENVCGDKNDWNGAQKLYQTALENLQSAFALARQVGDYHLMASSKLNIGSTLMRLGQPDQALKAYREGMRYARHTPGEMYKGLVRLNMGNAYVWLGDPKESLPYSQEALAIFKKMGRGTWQANALMNIGNAYLRENKFADAWETLHLALQVAQESGENRVYGRSLINLGMAGLQLRKKDSAALLRRGLQWYRNDTEIYPPIEREVVKEEALQMLGRAARQSGNTALADKYDEEFFQAMGSDPSRYQTLRESRCFQIYQARPREQKSASLTHKP